MVLAKDEGVRRQILLCLVDTSASDEHMLSNVLFNKKSYLCIECVHGGYVGGLKQ